MLRLPAVLTTEDLRHIHGTNERLSVDNLATSVKYFYQLVKNLDGM